jgi:hypothetical protein
MLLQVQKNFPKPQELQTYQLQMSITEHSSTCYFIRWLHNLLNVLVQIANKMGLQKKNPQQKERIS